jgi:hypothetical protein
MEDGNGGTIAKYVADTSEALLLWNSIHPWMTAGVVCAPIAATKLKKNHPGNLPIRVEVFFKPIHVKHHGNFAVQTAIPGGPYLCCGIKPSDLTAHIPEHLLLDLFQRRSHKPYGLGFTDGRFSSFHPFLLLYTLVWSVP